MKKLLTACALSVSVLGFSPPVLADEYCQFLKFTCMPELNSWELTSFQVNTRQVLNEGNWDLLGRGKDATSEETTNLQKKYNIYTGWDCRHDEKYPYHMECMANGKTITIDAALKVDYRHGVSNVAIKEDGQLLAYLDYFSSGGGAGDDAGIEVITFDGDELKIHSPGLINEKKLSLNEIRTEPFDMRKYKYMDVYGREKKELSANDQVLIRKHLFIK